MPTVLPVKVGRRAGSAFELPHVLFLSLVFPTKQSHDGHLFLELAEMLVRNGINVTVVATSAGLEKNIEEEFGCSFGEARLKVLRVGGKRYRGPSTWRKTANYLRAYPVLLWRALQVPRPKIVVTLTAPPLLLIFGPLIKTVTKCRLIHWSQDLYPEIAEELGAIKKGGIFAGFLRLLSTWALRRHNTIVAIGSCMKQTLVERGIAPEKIVVIPNWAQKVLYETTDETSRRLRTDLGLGEKFIVMYSGNFGLAHCFEAIAEAAEELARRSANVAFVFIGGGPRLGWLKQRTRLLNNVRFLPYQPEEMLGQSLRSADLHLVSMKEELLGLLVPSKIYGILAAGKPCIFLGPMESEAAQLLNRFKCGYVLSPENSALLVERILDLFSDVATLNQLAANARQAAKSLTGDGRFAEFRELFGIV